MTLHQMIFTTHNVIKQPSYVRNIQVVAPAPRSISRGINSKPNSFLRGLVFPSKAGCSTCGR